MLPADIKDRVAAQLTPRRRRYGLIFLVLFTVWSIIGLFALPGVIISQAQKFVQEKLHLELSIAKLEFNPWLLAVRIDDIKVKEPGASGETLVAARSIYVNAQLWSSLWIRGASLDELDLLDPYINARIRKDGSINLMQLVPPEDPEDSGEANWRVGTLGIHRGRIDIHDDTRPTPFSALFSPLNLALSDLSSRPDKDGGYTLHAETGEGEMLDWRGTVAMKPVRSEGELKISGLKATTPWRYLQDELPIIVEGGTIGISGHYKLVADNGFDFALEQGRVVVDELQLLQRNKAPLSITLKQLDLNGVHVKLPEQKAGFDNLLLKELLIADKSAEREFTRFGQLHLQGGSYEASPQSVQLTLLKLNELVLADNTTPALITLPGLSMEKLAVGLTEQKAHVSRIVLEKGDLSLRRNKNGSLNWQTRLDELSRRLADNPLPATAAPAPAEKAADKTTDKSAANSKPQKAAKAEPAKPWQATLGELDLLGFRVGIEDEVPPGGVKTSLEDINLRIFPQLDGNALHVLEGRMSIGTGGNFGFKGTFNEQPLAAKTDIDLQGLKLPPFAPYFADKARFALESGSLDVKGKFNFIQGKTAKADFNGSVAMQKFAANDLDQDQRFLAWNRLAVNGINWQLDPGRISIREVVADKPFIRVIIGQDKTINLNRILIAEEEATTNSSTASASASAAKPAEPPYPLKVDRIRMNDGSMLFADFTLNPQFATGIQSLNGDVRNISTDPKSRAKVDLKGRVDQYGKADINGVINPVSSDLYTDMKVQFSNLELTTLTPYSAKFAGYRIDKGKLSMDLNYKIEDRKLNASNKVVFNQLTLGEKIDSPDSVGLPLKLAVAILKDKNGVIDLDVPVTGSLDDPKFKVAPIIWKTFLNLLTKAATAPFTLIAGMVGGGDNMDAIIFLAGQTTLAPEETEKLNKLAKALTERPALGVEIRGAFDPAADALAVRTEKFDAVYLPRLGDNGKPRKVLEAMYKEKLGSEALEQQRALSLKPAADAAQNKEQLLLADENYAKVLRNELIARETVLEGDLRQLALQRASVVRAQLVDVAKVEEARVFVLEPVTVQATDGKIVMKVGLTAQ